MAQQCGSSETASNHFCQLQWRNIARAHINLGQYPEARQALDFLQSEANRSRLITDKNRNLIVEAIYAVQQKDEEQAKSLLKEALVLTNQTGMVGNFLIDGATIGNLLEN